MRSSRLPRPLTGLLAASLLLLAASACRKPAEPSELYTRAHSRFSKLYAEKGDDAFLDPAMVEIEAQLRNVPKESLDAQTSLDLLERIRKGRAQAEANIQALNDAVADASKPPTVTFASDNMAAERTPSSMGSGGPALPGGGTLVSELEKGFSGCFQKGQSVNVAGRGERDRWELADKPECREQYKALQDTLLLIEDGKVFATAPRSSLRVMSADGGMAGPAGP